MKLVGESVIQNFVDKRLDSDMNNEDESTILKSVNMPFSGGRSNSTVRQSV